MYIISACLLGTNCKYSGGSNETEWVKRFAEEHSICAVCPETLAGLPTPREPCERKDGKVVSKTGIDLTEEFEAGAESAYQVAMDEAEVREEKIEGAILKAKSPSCGAGKIYDGTFSHTVISGDGCFAKILNDHGIRIITDEESIDD